ncbi:hypothetical protein H0H93_008195 [Arthromyces matolae]|nr:hypothetical protein H0H93_008195 [Arthromyces matolae]
MSRQDKATTERFTRTLRELVKRPENKVCADCKRNDPRWASWNIGVFLCIRCSGIHRGMGTHISKVKSVDLDTWTPEQMEVSLIFRIDRETLLNPKQSIQKWGNHLANLYWEAHLKPGHVPPEHKIESFIRSKYESRRWALEGPPPSNPSDLEKTTKSSAPQSHEPPLAPPIPSSRGVPAPVARNTQSHPLLSSNFAAIPSRPEPTTLPQSTPPAAAAGLAQPKASENDLFSLDFHAPANSTPVASDLPKKDVKQDILSLFSSSQPPSIPVASTFGHPGVATSTSPWATATSNTQQQQPAMSGNGTAGIGAWGGSSGWVPHPVAASATASSIQSNWGATPSAVTNQSGLFNTAAVWGTSPVLAQDSFGPPPTAPVQANTKNDDAFGDLWGGFK